MTASTPAPRPAALRTCSYSGGWRASCRSTSVTASSTGGCAETRGLRSWSGRTSGGSRAETCLSSRTSSLRTCRLYRWLSPLEVWFLLHPGSGMPSCWSNRSSRPVREHVGRGGLVRDPEVHAATIRRTAEAFTAFGFGAADVARAGVSPDGGPETRSTRCGSCAAPRPPSRKSA